jgi:HPt (histidine-containing phosphotransfer) domain-containing protein
MSGSLKDVLAELQKNYLASMPEKIQNLEKLWSERKLELLKTDYHKLKGTGRTYGFPEITSLGAAMERLCEIDQSSLERAVPISVKLMTRIRDLRSKGQALDLDQEPDFKIIVTMVEAADRKTGS